MASAKQLELLTEQLCALVADTAQPLLVFVTAGPEPDGPVRQFLRRTAGAAKTAHRFHSVIGGGRIPLRFCFVNESGALVLAFATVDAPTAEQVALGRVDCVSTLTGLCQSTNPSLRMAAEAIVFGSDAVRVVELL